jgi:hypothetical protein
VTGYFAIINASAPHIYHSALVLAPQESTIRKLYESYTHPLTRLVHGAPTSWDLNTAATTRPSTIDMAVWSPCNKFIAITFGDNTMMVDVLDSVTLQQLQTLKFPQNISKCGRGLIFSPDSCILTCASGNSEDRSDLELFVISWDLQTGGITSIIRWQGPQYCVKGNPSITYSVDGRMVGIFYPYSSYISTAGISICDVASSIHTYSHSLNNNIPLSNEIWAHGESLQFATADTTTITIWEVGFISGNTPTKVKTLPAPDNFEPTMSPHKSECNPTGAQFLPALCLLALAFPHKLVLWDVRNSKHLQDFPDSIYGVRRSFSFNGCFFAYSATGNIYLWKGSPTGYILQGIVPLRSRSEPSLLLSPNGESIAVLYDHIIQSWPTKSFTTLPSSILNQSHQIAGDFILDFSPDRTLAVAVRKGNEAVTVLSFNSSVPQLPIDTGMGVHGLRIIGNTIVAIGHWEGQATAGCAWKAIAWNLPAEGCVPNFRVGLKDSSWAITLKDMPVIHGDLQYWPRHITSASISPDSHYIALTTKTSPRFGSATHLEIMKVIHLWIYSTSTGEYLGHELIEGGHTLWFTPDSCGVWCATNSGEAGVWRVGRGQNVLESLEHRVAIEHPPEGYPWGSTCGYQVTDDWWILSPGGKRLLMLPPPWQSYPVDRVWKGQFLALLHEGLSEPVVLEMEP